MWPAILPTQKIAELKRLEDLIMKFLPPESVCITKTKKE